MIGTRGGRRGRWRREWAWALGLALLLWGCSDGRDGRNSGRPPFLAFGCGDEQLFLAAFSGADTARLAAADGVEVMLRVRSASGVRYAGARDTLWTKGDDVLLIRDGRTFAGCAPTGRQEVLADLWRGGAVFTAAGNEPFWTMTVWPDSLVLLLDLGATRLTHRIDPAAPWPGAAAGYADSAAGIAVTAVAGPCLDTMSGAPYPWAVTVAWGGQEFNGCGLALGPRF